MLIRWITIESQSICRLSSHDDSFPHHPAPPHLQQVINTPRALDLSQLRYIDVLAMLIVLRTLLPPRMLKLYIRHLEGIFERYSCISSYFVFRMGANNQFQLNSTYFLGAITTPAVIAGLGLLSIFLYQCALLWYTIHFKAMYNLLSLGDVVAFVVNKLPMKEMSNRSTMATLKSGLNIPPR